MLGVHAWPLWCLAAVRDNLTLIKIGVNNEECSGINCREDGIIFKCIKITVLYVT
jgi:hypothetical protein